MGCFSFLSLKSGKPALSTSFDGSPCWLFRLCNGIVVEYMHGNYDSYGRVFDGKGESFKWEVEGLDTAMLLEDEWQEGDPFPTEPSEGDPDQGWGSCWEHFGDTRDDAFPKVENPKHVVIKENAFKARVSIFDYQIKWCYSERSDLERRLEKANKAEKPNLKFIKDLNECILDHKERLAKLKAEKEEFITKNKEYDV